MFWRNAACGLLALKLGVTSPPQTQDQIMSVDIGSFITCTPGIVGGRPRIAGTRVPVQTIAIFYKRGESPEEIGLQYPHLSMAQIYAALTYLSRQPDRDRSQHHRGGSVIRPASA
jgi:uncharacterized protein (DUF433 family)